MTVSTEETSTGLLPGNGATTLWPFSFPVPDAGQVRVLRYDPSGVGTPVPAGDFTVALVERGRSGGIVTYPINGTQVPEGEFVEVERDPSFLQPTLLSNQSAYNPTVVMGALDLAAMRDQRLRDRLDRTPALGRQYRPAGYKPPVDGNLTRWELQQDGSWLIGNVPPAENVASSLNDAGFLSARDIGLALDGVNDDSLLLNNAIRDLSTAGGGTIALWSETGGVLYVSEDINVRSGVSLIVGVPVEAAPGVGIKAAGSIAMRSDGLRLLTNATAGDSTIAVDTATSGGVPVSTLFPVGTRIRIEGLLSAAGTPLEKEWNTVVSVDDALKQVALATPLTASYKVAYPAAGYQARFGVPNLSRIAIPRQAALAANAVPGLATVTLAAGWSGISMFDWVIVGDERKTTSGVDTHMEIAQVVDIAGDVLTLNRKVRRAYATASRARVTVMAPVVQATVQGASVTFRGVAAGGIDATFNISYAVDCRFVDCAVPNTDNVGSRDTMFRTDYAFNSGFVNPVGRNPKFLAAGEGNGVIFAYSTRCYADGPALSGCRHDVQYVAATECIADAIESDDNRLSSVDFHGCNSVGCGAMIRNLSTAGRTASASNGAIIFGNPSHDAGDHYCWAMGGEVGPFAGTTGHYAVQFVQPSSNCYVVGTKFRDIEKLVLVRDIAGRADLISQNCGVMDVHVDGCSGYLVDVQCNLGGSTAKNIAGLFLIGIKGRDLKRGVFVRQADRVRFEDCLMVAADTPDAGAPFALYLNDVTALRVVKSNFVRYASGAQVTACPGHRFQRCDFEDLTGNTVLSDVSGNTGAEWRMCDYPGVAAPSLGAAGLIAHYRGQNDKTNTARLAADVTCSSATVAVAAGMSLPIIAGHRYHWKLHALFSTADVNTGISVRTSYGGGAATLQGVGRAIQTTGGTSAEYQGRVAGTGQGIFTTANPNVGERYYGTIEGIAQPVNSVNFSFDFLSEVDTSLVTLHAGSFFELREIP